MGEKGSGKCEVPGEESKNGAGLLNPQVGKDVCALAEGRKAMSKDEVLVCGTPGNLFLVAKQNR